MKSRYCYCPMTAKRVGRRVTMADRLRRWMRNRHDRTEGYPFGNYNSPVYPGK